MLKGPASLSCLVQLICRLIHAYKQEGYQFYFHHMAEIEMDCWMSIWNGRDRHCLIQEASGCRTPFAISLIRAWFRVLTVLSMGVTETIIYGFLQWKSLWYCHGPTFRQISLSLQPDSNILGSFSRTPHLRPFSCNFWAQPYQPAVTVPCVLELSILGSN